VRKHIFLPLQRCFLGTPNVTPKRVLYSPQLLSLAPFSLHVRNVCSSLTTPQAKETHEIRRSAFPLLHIAPFITEVNRVEYDMVSQQDSKDMYVHSEWFHVVHSVSVSLLL